MAENPTVITQHMSLP